MLNLPTQPVKAEMKNPMKLIVMGKPKTGKTTAVAALKDCLVINFEDKKQTADGMIHYMEDVSMKSLTELANEIESMGKPYKYIALDTITKLEELLWKEAERLYMSTPTGVNWIKKNAEGKLLPTCGKYKYKELIFLPNGSAYQFLTKTITKVINKFEQLAENIIFIAHVKDTMLMKDGVEFTSLDLNLTGKNKGILAQMAHAIGYIERRGKQNFIQFKPSDDVLAGCKIKRLEGKEFLLSEYNEEGDLVTYWDNIYVD
jgi:hypothetical protein